MTERAPRPDVPAASLAPAALDGEQVSDRDLERSAAHDYGKMLAVGAVGLLIDFGLFNLLLQAGWNAVWANLLALVVAGLITFKGNLSLTFAHRNVPDRRQALIRFAVVTVLSVLFVETAVALAGLLSASVMTLNLVKGGVTAIAVVARFYSYREWVFQHVTPPPIPGTTETGTTQTSKR